VSTPIDELSIEWVPSVKATGELGSELWVAIANAARIRERQPTRVLMRAKTQNCERVARPPKSA